MDFVNTKLRHKLPVKGGYSLLGRASEPPQFTDTLDMREKVFNAHGHIRKHGKEKGPVPRVRNKDLIEKGNEADIFEPRAHPC
jgi:hypothetical protein